MFMNTKSPRSDIQCYWAFFKEFVEACEEYAEISKIKEEIFESENPDISAFIKGHSKSWRAEFLGVIEKKANLRRIYGFKMSMCMEANSAKFLSSDEANLLLDALSDRAYRDGFYDRIAKYSKEEIFVFPTDVLEEVGRMISGEGEL